jgi:hypothetical protein
VDSFVETSATLAIVNPIAEPRSEDEGAPRFPPAKRPETLEGKTVALYWNGKQNGLDALTRAKATLTARYDDIRFIEITGALGGTNRYLSAEQLAFLQAEADVALCTTADCGSCTSWLMRDLCELERHGVPAAGLTAAIFAEDAQFSTRTFGVPEACPIIVPECFSNKTPEETGDMVDAAMDAIVEALTRDREVMSAPPSSTSCWSVRRRS